LFIVFLQIAFVNISIYRLVQKVGDVSNISSRPVLCQFSRATDPQVLYADRVCHGGRHIVLVFRVESDVVSLVISDIFKKICAVIRASFETSSE